MFLVTPILSANPIVSKSFSNIDVPWFLRPAVTIAKEFLVIASIGFIVIFLSEPLISMSNGLLGIILVPILVPVILILSASASVIDISL